MDDARLAAQIATEAGRLLLQIRDAPSDAEVGREGDRRSHDLIAARLQEHRPHDAVLSEESADDGERLHATRVWIIDPLDGTREFAEAGRADWAVHVALWETGALIAGAVALPALGSTLSTLDAKLAPAPLRRLRVILSRTRPPEVPKSLEAEVLALGSAGAKVATIIRGEADAYIHAGGMHEWDSAAPVAVAVKAGLHVSRLDGSPLLYNQRDPSTPELLVCRREVADTVLKATREMAS
jgi:3'(2'), 5'-bisphosphate nucleotidase